MKKIYGFIALMMLLFVGNAQAQRAWDKVSEESVTEIKTDGTLYVLQEGFNNSGWSSNGYLNSGADEVVAEINTSCVYEFVATGEVKEAGGEEFQIYVLKAEPETGTDYDQFHTSLLSYPITIWPNSSTHGYRSVTLCEISKDHSGTKK